MRFIKIIISTVHEDISEVRVLQNELPSQMENLHFDADKPSLLWLSDDALLELFKYLRQSDALSLAGTCCRLQELSYRNFNSVELCPTFSEKDDLHNSNLFNIIGRHLRILTIDFNDTDPSNKLKLTRLKHLFASISKSCKSLERLTIFNFRVYHRRFSPNDLLADLIRVTSLYFFNCNLTYGNKLFRILRNVESLVVQNELCTTSDIDFGKFFRKNNEIKHFAWNKCLLKRFDDTKVFEALPKLQNLSINIEKISKVSSLNHLIKLEQLKHLRIGLMKKINVNKFLNQLALKSELEELCFGIIEVNEATLQALQNFQKLTGLTLHCSRELLFRLNSHKKWPQNLQLLKLVEADVEIEGFLSVIRNLRSLKTFILSNCYVNGADEAIVYDRIKFSQKYLKRWTFQKTLASWKFRWLI